MAGLADPAVQGDPCSVWCDPVACIAAVALVLVIGGILAALLRNRARTGRDPAGMDLVWICLAVFVIAAIGVAYMVWTLHCACIDAGAGDVGGRIIGLLRA